MKTKKVSTNKELRIKKILKIIKISFEEFESFINNFFINLYYKAIFRFNQLYLMMFLFIRKFACSWVIFIIFPISS